MIKNYIRINTLYLLLKVYALFYKLNTKISLELFVIVNYYKLRI